MNKVLKTMGFITFLSSFSMGSNPTKKSSNLNEVELKNVELKKNSELENKKTEEESSVFTLQNGLFLLGSALILWFGVPRLLSVIEKKMKDRKNQEVQRNQIIGSAREAIIQEEELRRNAGQYGTTGVFTSGGRPYVKPETNQEADERNRRGTGSL